jgi:hypothetical protein
MPILLLSSNPDGARTRCRGLDAILQKPVLRAELYAPLRA